MHLQYRQIPARKILALLMVLIIASSNLMVTRGQVRANYDLGVERTRAEAEAAADDGESDAYRGAPGR
jgi:hypothetical protein